MRQILRGVPDGESLKRLTAILAGRSQASKVHCSLLPARSLFILVGAFCFPAFSEEQPPSFVIILADDLGYQDIGGLGSPDIRTPRLDQMASEGMKYTDFYAQPICGPSRAALMTGCYPLRVAEKGVIKNSHPILHAEEITIAELLQTQGYATGCFGKWGLAGHTQDKERNHFDLFPTHQGFDEFFGTPGSNDRLVDLYRGKTIIEPDTDMSVLTRRYTDEAIRFMEKNRERPFFVYIPHTMPHTRLDSSEQFKGKSKRGLYGDVVEELDHNVGRILDAIRVMGLQQRTYVLFTSDNGPWLKKNRNYADGHLPEDHGGSAGPLRSGKVSTFEGGVRVPTLLWAPGRVPAGTVCAKLASSLDVLPTFAALAGAQVPNDRVIDGEDIRHLFQGDFGKADPQKTHFYYLRTHLQAVRQGKWKLHLARPADRKKVSKPNRHIAPADNLAFEQPFLVDLDADLGETRNVAKQFPAVAKRLQGLAEAMREDLGDYDRVGKNMRFFGLTGTRPTVPPTPETKKKKARTGYFNHSNWNESIFKADYRSTRLAK